MEDSDHERPHTATQASLKKWDSQFSTPNLISNVCDPSVSAWLKEQNPDRDILETFFRDTDKSVPSREVEQARKFLREDIVEEFQLKQSDRTWVEYRKKSTDHCRSLPERPSNERMHKVLEEWASSTRHYMHGLRGS